MAPDLDPFGLTRFVDAQAPVHESALAELRAGRKRTHWMWFVFPQIAGLGHSAVSVRYALSGAAEAAAYLHHPVLGPRLLECAEAVLAVPGRSAHDIFGSPDDAKLRSCATLFAHVSEHGSVFARLLERYFPDGPDPRTLARLATRATATPIIRALTSADRASIDGLSALLLDAVDNGASVGFLAPLAKDDADGYWRDVLDSLGPNLMAWIAEEDGRIVGSVQLAPAAKPNARHRAEVQKLLVLRSARGQGIASALMAAAERHAAALGRTLLVLDTQAGSAAESLYRRLGWLAAGHIPDYAASPDGMLHPTAYYYKQLLT